MQRLYLILLFFICLSVGAQPYSHFVVEGAHWEVYAHGCPAGCDGMNAYPHIENTAWYKLEGDIVLDSVVYKKLYRSYTSLYSLNSNDGNTTNSSWNVYGYVREDTALQKVYIRAAMPLATECWSFPVDVDMLWFDFSKTIGDTIRLQSERTHIPLGCQDELYRIDTITNNYTQSSFNGSRKAFRVSPVDSTLYIQPFWLIQGIGQSYGLFGAATASFEGDFSSSLVSYCIGSDSICGRGYVYSDIAFNEREAGVSIHPNPFSSQLTLSTNNTALSAMVTIQDLTGRVVGQWPMHSNQLSVDLNRLERGVYIATITMGNGYSASRKIIKD